MRRLLLLALLAALLGGCATGLSTTGTSSSAHHGPPRPRHRHREPPRHRHHRRVRLPGLAYSTASGDQVQPQPAAGSCHASRTGLYSRPDRHCTPGALNPAVTQATIDRTICVSGYTSTIRPPEGVSEDEKRASLAAYGDAGPMSSYEYDHLVSLELGGAVNDPRNLWPEPGASPNPKDAVEDELHDMVCDGEISLARAQRIIATDWVGWARHHDRP